MVDPHLVTRLLRHWAEGDPEPRDKLIPLVYAELRQIAARYLRVERPDHSLQPTALVHEAYLRLVGQESPHFENRAYFFGVAARLMREILVDHARRRHAGKRAGCNVSVEEAVGLAYLRPEELLALDEALTELRKFDERKSQAVELRYFGGLMTEEIAATLGVSPVTVRRDLRMAEAWLHREMGRLQ
jgi:RNA polymerase sigma-70 factor, ECF subfamily